MTTKTEVAVREDAALPALAPTPALASIGSKDIALPRLYKGETQGNAFKDDLVPKGCIFVASGGDDPNPEVIWEQGNEEGVLVHILDVFKRKSMKVGDDFTTWAFDDPDAPADADVDYHYVVVLPEVDPDVPVKVTLAKTSVPTAKRINFLLLKNQGKGALYSQAFRLTLKQREATKGGTKYQWYVWQASLVESDPANVAIAERAAQLVSAGNNDIEASAGPENQPGI